MSALLPYSLSRVAFYSKLQPKFTNSIQEFTPTGKQVSVQAANSDGQTNLTVAIGSPGYMPNEQLSGKPRFCSDIYAVGMIGIQALTGHSKTVLSLAISPDGRTIYSGSLDGTIKVWRSP